MTIQFNNRENERIVTEDGREVWLSRACAVVAQICLYNTTDKTWHMLLGKRGSGTPDFQGYWCFPCGYLDWDETLTQGMIREVWEECGFYLPSLSEHPNFIYSENPSVQGTIEVTEIPWHVSDRPTSRTQNISFHYAIICKWDGSNFPVLSNKYCEPNEVDDLGWFTVEEVSNITLAFNHNECLVNLLQEQKDAFQRIESI